MRTFASFALLFFLSSNGCAANPPSDEVKAQVRKATVAQAYRLARETDKAITAYHSYLRSNPRGDQRALAETKLRELGTKEY